jgi:hypothetical protein
MTGVAILLPVFVQVALTFTLLVWMGRLRIRSLRVGTARLGDIALGEPKWPIAALKVQNAFHNQFELPLLFYALVALALITRQATTLMAILCWLFVISRVIHALIHATTNHVPSRFWAYVFGMTVLILMWLWFAARVIA